MIVRQPVHPEIVRSTRMRRTAPLRDLARETPEDQTLGVDHDPLPLDLGRLG